MLFQLINTCLQPELKLGYGVAAPGFEQFSGKDLLLYSPYNSIGMSIVISLVFIDLYLSNLRSFTKQGQQDDSFNSSVPSQIDTQHALYNKKGLYRSVVAYSRGLFFHIKLLAYFSLLISSFTLHHTTGEGVMADIIGWIRIRLRQFFIFFFFRLVG